MERIRVIRVIFARVEMRYTEIVRALESFAAQYHQAFKAYVSSMGSQGRGVGENWLQLQDVNESFLDAFPFLEGQWEFLSSSRDPYPPWANFIIETRFKTNAFDFGYTPEQQYLRRRAEDDYRALLSKIDANFDDQRRAQEAQARRGSESTRSTGGSASSNWLPNWWRFFTGPGTAEGSRGSSGGSDSWVTAQQREDLAFFDVDPASMDRASIRAAVAKSYRRKAMENHPDRRSGKEDVMKLINEIRDRLSADGLAQRRVGRVRKGH